MEIIFVLAVCYTFLATRKILYSLNNVCVGPVYLPSISIDVQIVLRKTKLLTNPILRLESITAPNFKMALNSS